LLPYATLEKSDKEGEQAIQLILNNYELMSISIQRGILDYGIIKRYARGTILKHWDAASPFISKLRSDSSNDLIYFEFETLRNWINDTKTKPNGKFWSLIF